MRYIVLSCLLFLVGCSGKSPETGEHGKQKDQTDNGTKQKDQTNDATKPPKTEDATKPPKTETVSVAQLLSVYWEYGNELPADTKYLNKLVVSRYDGGITRKNPTNGRYSVCMCVWADKAFEADLVCELTPECAKLLATMSSKKELSIRGICKGRFGNPANYNGYEVRFVDCEIFETPKGSPPKTK
jgi:hypothetical protein